MLHRSRRLEDSSRMESPEDFTQRMVNSDHRPAYIQKVLMAEYTGYKAKLRNSKLTPTNPAYKPLHLDTKFNMKGMWKNKVLAKDIWFQEAKNDGKLNRTKLRNRIFQKGCGARQNMEASTVKFIPSTKGGILTKMM